MHPCAVFFLAVSPGMLPGTRRYPSAVAAEALWLIPLPGELSPPFFLGPSQHVYSSVTFRNLQRPGKNFSIFTLFGPATKQNIPHKTHTA